jgi:hypothetical protein
MTLNPQMAPDGERHGNAADRSAAAVDIDTFVINLCSSTTPMALAHPDAPELKRFRFFVSRRLEDGRERFRLHMGYFETLEEAEDWLSVVRDVYPGAWAGEAPGKRLRMREAAMARSAPALVPPVSNTAPAEVNVAHSTPPPSAIAAPPPAVPAEIARAAAALPERARPAVQRAPHPDLAAPAPKVIGQPAPAPRVEQRRDAPAAAAAAPARAAPRAPLSNVREVLAALDESDNHRATPSTAAPPPATSTATRARPSLSDTQVMQILEARRTDAPIRGDADAAPSGIPLRRPDDSGTRRALKAAVQDNAAVSFAVQLQWSVQPMALDKVPPLAIFSAYTLYTVEGSREGRAWYGLRLGFFSDAAAAKQVAHYVRSDFASVAVVPVSAQERGRAASTDQRTSATIFAEAPPATPPPDEITLLDTEPKAAAEIPVAAPSGGAKTGSAAARAAAARSKKLRSKERTPQSKRPYSLEETLEILGAGSLEIDEGRGELINESRVRHVHVEIRKDSPFQRLITRLTERVRKS